MPPIRSCPTDGNPNVGAATPSKYTPRAGEAPVEPAWKGFADFNKSNLAKDRDGDPVFMARSSWDVSYQQERNPELVFSATKER